MKKKLTSILIVIILSLNTFLCNATNISFDDLENNSTLIYLENSEIIDTKLSENNILATSFSETTKNISTITQTDSVLSSSSSLDNNIVLEKAISTMNLNISTITNYMSFSKNNTIFIDVTDLIIGNIVSHDCSKYLGANFDETNHWEECTICGKQFNILPHNYTSYWLMGNSCSQNNKLRHTCDYGYYYYETPNTRNHSTGRAVCNPSYCSWFCSACHDVFQYFGNAHYNNSGQQLGCVTGRSGTYKLWSILECKSYWKYSIYG